MNSLLIGLGSVLVLIGVLTPKEKEDTVPPTTDAKTVPTGEIDDETTEKDSDDNPS